MRMICEQESEQEKLWQIGHQRYMRLCEALGKDDEPPNDVYEAFMRAFSWTCKHDYSFFTALGGDKYAWMDGPHIEAIYHVMRAQLTGG